MTLPIKLTTLLITLAALTTAMAETKRFVLTDTTQGIHVESFNLSSKDLGMTDGPAWSIRKYTLHGGKEEGVEVIEVDNGKLTFSVIPTRGMSIYRVTCSDVRLGWDSPVKDLVNPAFINLEDNGGLGWLDGFNEMMVRCGYQWAGHPGDDNGRLLTLHGKAGNIPASIVVVSVDTDAPHTIRIRGQVNETSFKFADYQAWTEINTTPGSATFSLNDEVTNLSDYDREFQLIYHANFGPPLLEKGSEFVAAVNTVTPFDDAANKPAEVKNWTTYKGPTKGYGETVYCLVPYGDKKGNTTVMLKNAKGDRGIACSYNIKQLPNFALWKNTDTLHDGYVTGLEPTTSFPTTRNFERKAGRVPTLKAGQSRQFQLSYTVLLDAASVARTASEISKIQGKRKTTVSEKTLK
ncbi:MAG: aldose 1-epimerase family protein [Kiritimatiellae bacterium]|nr:aldose 1-epimerase family protein [Kiritimatiellia bacterium]